MQSTLCSICGVTATRVWELSCPNRCGRALYACLPCVRSGDSGRALEAHLRSCDAIDLPQTAILAGPTQAPPVPPPVTPDFHQIGAAAGAKLGAQHSPKAALAGGVLGAVAGLMAKRAAQRPDMRQTIELISEGGRALRDVLGVVKDAVAKASIRPNTSQAPPEESFFFAPPGKSTPRR